MLGDGSGSLGMDVHGIPVPRTLPSSIWERQRDGAAELWPLGHQCLGMSTQKSGAVRLWVAKPCSGLLPASQPVLAAEALFFFGRAPGREEHPLAAALSPGGGCQWSLGCCARLLPELGKLRPEVGKAPFSFGFPGLTLCKGAGGQWWHHPSGLPATSLTPPPPAGRC